MAKSTLYCREGCDIYSSWLRHEDTIAELQSQLAGAEQELICLHIAIDREVEKNKGLCGKELELQEKNKRLAEFARRVINVECWACYEELDGYDLQEIAIKLGLIKRHIVTEDEADDLFEAGDTKYRFTEILEEKENEKR